jgi:hypothetical protein
VDDNRKIVTTAEVRRTSGRHSGKHPMQVQGKPMLGYLIDRLKVSPGLVRS